MRQPGVPRISYGLGVLSKAWTIAGRRLGQAGTHGCVVDECRSLAYVALKTAAGNRPVCFRHYSLLDEGEIAG